jgi:hypothetical protein
MATLTPGVAALTPRRGRSSWAAGLVFSIGALITGWPA